MSIFRYRARDAEGGLIQGRIEADGADQAAGRLQRDGLYPMNIQELRGHFKTMFIDIGSSLPLPTRVLIGLCSILTRGWWVILIILLGGIFILGQYTRSENGRFHFSRIFLGIPFIGQVRRRFSAARFSKTLQILINSGVPLLDGLGITRDMEGNEVLKREVERLYHLVKSGEGLAASMSGSPFFSPLEIDMVRVGENSGDLAGALCRIAEIYEEEVDRSLKRLVSLLEPAIILFMGGVVGFIVLAMLLPVFRMGTLIR